MCKLLAALPICCKLISRLSLFVLVLKRLVDYLFTCDLTRSQDSPDDSMTESSTSADADVNIIRPKGIRSSKKGGNHHHRTIPTHTVSMGRKLARFIRSLFEWPFVSVIIVLIWIGCLGVSWPLFSSYLVRDDVCDSEYRFPEDIRAVQSLWFNYLVYGKCLVYIIVIF